MPSSPVYTAPAPLDPGQEEDDDDSQGPSDGITIPVETTYLPDPELIVEGTVLLVALVLFVDIPLAIGLVEFFPELEVGMVLTETYLLALVVVDAHIHAIDLIYEGFTEEEIIPPIINFR